MCPLLLDHYSIRKDKKVLLAVFDAKTLKMIGGTHSAKNAIIYSFRWANHERLLYRYAKRYSGSDKYLDFGELFAVNFDGSKNKILFGLRSGGSFRHGVNSNQAILSLLEDDPEHILLTEYDFAKSVKNPLISKLNVYTGQRKIIERIPYPDANIFADKKGNVRFLSWYDKKDGLQIATREQKKAPWKVISLGGSNDSNSIGTPLWINKSGSTIYLKARTGKNKLMGLRAMDLETGQLTTVFSDDTLDMLEWEVDESTYEPIVGVAALANERYQYSSVESNGQLKKIHKKLVKGFPNQNVAIISQTKDGTMLIVRVESDTNPGEYYLYENNKNEARFLWPVLSWVDPGQMQPMQLIKFTARDGLPIHGFITLPAKVRAKKTPLIVRVYRSVHETDRWRFDQEVQLLANRGYAVLQVNFRGSYGFGQLFEQKGNGQWGGKMIDDIIDGTQWALANYQLAKDKVCIYGGSSYGGYAALMSAVKAPDMFQCAIGYAGVYDLTMLDKAKKTPWGWGGKVFFDAMVKKHQVDLLESSPIHHADKIQAKVMLVHGAQDIESPILHAHKMRKALKKDDKKPVWIKYHSAGLRIVDINNKKDFYHKMLQFLQANIPVE